MANAPVAPVEKRAPEKAPPPGPESAPAKLASVRARVLPGCHLAVGRDTRTRGLVVKRGGEWVNVTPTVFTANRRFLETEEEAAARDKRAPAAVAEASHESLQLKLEQFRQQERLTREREREARKGLVDAMVPEPKFRQAPNESLEDARMRFRREEVLSRERQKQARAHLDTAAGTKG